MKIWELKSDLNGFASLSSKNHDKSFKISMILDGRRLTKDWTPLEYTKYYEHKELPLSDKPNSTSTPIFSAKAVICLKEFLGNNVEILPVNVEGEEFYLINVLDVVDCLDYEKSEITYSRRKPDKIILIDKFAFVEDKIKHKDLFKLKEHRVTAPFVSDRFKEKVEECGLLGFEFVELWDSEKQ